MPNDKTLGPRQAVKAHDQAVGLYCWAHEVNDLLAHPWDGPITPETLADVIDKVRAISKVAIRLEDLLTHPTKTVVR